jgi:hypothetical protein
VFESRRPDQQNQRISLETLPEPLRRRKRIGSDVKRSWAFACPNCKRKALLERLELPLPASWGSSAAGFAATGPEDEHRSKIIGKRVDRVLEQATQLPVSGQPLGIRLRRSHRLDSLYIPVSLAAAHVLVKRDDPTPPPRPAQRLIEGDPGEPCREAVWADELVELRIGTDIGFLDDVLGLGPVPQDAARQAEEAPVVAAHDELERHGITRSHSLDPLIIG